MAVIDRGFVISVRNINGLLESSYWSNARNVSLEDNYHSMSEYVTSIRVFLEMISNLKTKGYFFPIYLVTKISNFMLDSQAILIIQR